MAIEGLTFNDIVYYQDIGHVLPTDQFYVAFNSNYLKAISQISLPQIFSLRDDPLSAQYIKAQLQVYHRSIKGATTHRHYHEEDYDDGSVCAVTG